jgi:hypothetical protein
MRFPRNAQVGKIDRYEAQFDPDWLGTESIASCTVTASSAVITVGAITISGASVFFMFTANSLGTVEIEFVATTSPGGRTICRHGTIVTEEC